MLPGHVIVGDLVSVVTCTFLLATAEPQLFVTVYLIVAVPTPTAVAVPVLAFIVTTDVLVLLHTPPGVPLLVNVELLPIHGVEATPLIVPALAAAFTVSALMAEAEPQLFVTVYFTVTEPAAVPVTTPPEVIVAVPVPFTIDQVPPEVASVNAGVEAPTHTLDAPPPMAATVGVPFTVSALVAEAEPQLFVTVYFTVTEPAAVPVTMPPEVMVAEPVPFTIDHVPPEVASVNAGVEAPTHTLAAPPPIAATVGVPFTVTALVAEAEPQLFVTVYFTVTEPAAVPVTIPPEVMVAEPVPFTIDHVPPEVASVNAGVEAPTHTLDAPPPIADNIGVAKALTAFKT
jgi:hypothetical protein